MLPDLKVGVCVILRYGSRVLMGKRRGSHGAGTWSFPGGHLDPNETIEDAVRRELAEETAIQFKGPLRPLTFVENTFPEHNRRYVTLYMEGTLLEYQQPLLLEPNKCEGWEWVEAASLPQPLFSPVAKLLASGFNLGVGSSS